MGTNFTEVQSFAQFWLLWIIEIPIALLVVYIMYKYARFLKRKEEKVNPIFSAFLYLLLLLPFVGLYFTLAAKLTTRIDAQGIHLSFYPFKNKKEIHWTSIAKIYVRQYRPILEYGGWGLRGRSGNTAYNVSGDEGIQIEFKNGNKFLIGTQKPEEAQVVITALSNNLTP